MLPKNTCTILLSHGIIRMRLQAHPGSERHLIFLKAPLVSLIFFKLSLGLTWPLLMTDSTPSTLP